MSLRVTILLPDGSPIDPGLDIQLLSGSKPVAEAKTADDGTVTFEVDPSTLVNPAIRLV